MYVRTRSPLSCALVTLVVALTTSCTADQSLTGVEPTRASATPTLTDPLHRDVNASPTTMSMPVVVQTAVAAGKCVSVAGGSPVAPAPGTPAVISTCGRGANQQLVLQPSGTITAYNGTRCLDVSSGRGNDGNSVITWPCHGRTNQRWTVTASGQVRTAVNGKCLDVDYPRTQYGTRLQIWSCHGGVNQRWAVVPTATMQGGVPVNPGDNLQAKVDANPAGTTFLLRAGVYAKQTVIPKTGDAFVGDTGAVLDGGNVTPYAFWIGTATPYPADVRIENLEIRGYTPPMAFAPVRAGGDLPADGSRGWTVTGNYIHHNAFGGVRVGHLTVVRNNRILHNGMSGVMGVGDSVLVEGNELGYNNYQRTVDPAWGGGGLKLTESRWAVVRGNFSHHNTGAGLWSDINCVNTVYENNRVEDNTHAGIFYEISYTAVIRNNRVARNGFGSQGWLFGAGILVSESPDVEVVGNTLVDNAVGIAGKQQVRGEPAEHGLHVLERLWVHNNVVTLTAVHAGAMNVLAGIGQDVADGASYYATRGNQFDANQYTGPSTLATPFHWNDGLRGWNNWRTSGQEANGRYTTR